MIETIKQLSKTKLPPGIVQAIKSLNSARQAAGIYRGDKKRFERNYSRTRSKRKNQLDSRLIFHTHAIEKGLSHDEIRLGFGIAALTKLSEYMAVYTSLGFNRDAKAYINALSTLREYIEIHEESGYALSYLNEIFSASILEEAKNSSSRIGGRREVHREEKINNTTKNFEEIITGRWSVREYSEIPVDLEKLTEAVEIAMKSPSVCNRQPSRVRIIDDAEKITKVLQIQGGMTGYETPPVLLVVTSEISSFIHPTERNQPYVDGGLFSMSLLLSLEYQKLAACPLNAMFDLKKDSLMRKQLEIPDSELFIFFIAVGNFKQKTNVPKSFRYSSAEVLKMI